MKVVIICLRTYKNPYDYCHQILFKVFSSWYLEWLYFNKFNSSHNYNFLMFFFVSNTLFYISGLYIIHIHFFKV